MRFIPHALSSWRLIAPGILHQQDKAGGRLPFGKRGPSASRIKLRRALVKRRTTGTAIVHALTLEFLVFSCPGHLCALLSEDAELCQ